MLVTQELSRSQSPCALPVCVFLLGGAVLLGGNEQSDSLGMLGLATDLERTMYVLVPKLSPKLPIGRPSPARRAARLRCQLRKRERERNWPVKLEPSHRGKDATRRNVVAQRRQSKERTKEQDV